MALALRRNTTEDRPQLVGDPEIAGQVPRCDLCMFPGNSFVPVLPFIRIWSRSHQAQQFDWLRQDYPDLFRRLQLGASRGKFLPVGGTWVEMDVNMPCCESLCRQFLYGQRFFRTHFGRHCTEVRLYCFVPLVVMVMDCVVLAPRHLRLFAPASPDNAAGRDIEVRHSEVVLVSREQVPGESRFHDIT